MSAYSHKRTFRKTFSPSARQAATDSKWTLAKDPQFSILRPRETGSENDLTSIAVRVWQPSTRVRRRRLRTDPAIQRKGRGMKQNKSPGFSRRDFVKSTGSAALAAAAGLGLPGSRNALAQDAGRYNILMIVTDQERYLTRADLPDGYRLPCGPPMPQTSIR